MSDFIKYFLNLINLIKKNDLTWIWNHNFLPFKINLSSVFFKNKINLWNEVWILLGTITIIVDMYLICKWCVIFCSNTFSNELSFDITIKNDSSWWLLNVYVKILYTPYITAPSRICSVTDTSVDYALEKGSLVLWLSIVQYVYIFEKLHCFLLFSNCLTHSIK